MLARPATLAVALLAACPADDDDSAPPAEPVAWVALAPSPQSSVGEDVVAMPDGGAVAVGAFAGSMTFGPGSANETALTAAGDFDAFVARFGPDGALMWAERIGGAGTDWAWSVDVDGDDRVWVSGQFGQTATFGAGQAGEAQLTSAGGQDAFVARYAGDGTLQFARAAGGDNQQVAWSVSATDDGGAFVAGHLWANITFGAGEPNETILLSLAAQDAFVARYDPDGAFEWVKTVTGGGSVVAYDVAATDDGGAFLVGEFTAAAVAGSGEANETSLASIAGNLDSFVARYAADGSLAWARNDATSFPDGARAGVADGDGAWAVGVFRGSGVLGDVDVASGGFDDGYALQYDADGVVQTVRTAGGSGAQGSLLPRGVATSGGTIVVGQFSASATWGSESTPVSWTHLGAGDGFVALYDDVGNLEYAAPVGGAGQRLGAGRRHDRRRRLPYRLDRRRRRLRHRGGGRRGRHRPRPGSVRRRRGRVLPRPLPALDV